MAAEAGPSMFGGGAGQKETLANHGRQGSQKGISEGWTIKEAPEVLAGDSSSPQDLLVPEEH